MNKNNNKIVGIIMLLTCTILWGAAFSFQSIASDHIGPFSLIAIRFILAGLILTPFALIRIKVKKIQINWKKILIGGFLTGAFLSIASVLQQFGIAKTSTGKAGFLTAMYIAFVPIISVFVFRKKIKICQITGIVVTIVGAGLMSLGDDFSINIGDVLCLGGAIFYACQIMAIDRFTNGTDSLTLAVVSFYVTGIIALFFGLGFEKTTFDNIKDSIIPIIYLALGSTAIAYTLQFVGQKKISGVPASLIMSLEAVFSAIFAWIILQEMLAPRELIGALLMLIGVIVVQIFDK